MRVLVACEYSGRVRDAFRNLGHDAVSCDLVPSHRPGPHIQGDVAEVVGDGWDLMIAFPPCTHLASSGARWWPDKRNLQEQALSFVQALMEAPIPKIAIENPVGVISTRVRKPDQIIQPWWFGDPFRKTTCLWLKGLPLLRATQIVNEGVIAVHGGRRIPQWYSNRERDRSETFPGVALAMADQWGGPL